jgi:RNA polymerase sigma factor (sigma-70 family)
MKLGEKNLIVAIFGQDIPFDEVGLVNALNTLNPREKFVLEQRFGLSGDKGKTLREISEKLLVTRERVGQIEHKALRKMKYLLYPLREDL